LLEKKLLLLDLDETLIHSVQLVPGAPITQTFSYVLNIPLDDGTGQVEVRIINHINVISYLLSHLESTLDPIAMSS